MSRVNEIVKAINAIIDAVLDIDREFPEGKGIQDNTWKKIEDIEWDVLDEPETERSEETEDTEEDTKEDGKSPDDA